MHFSYLFWLAAVSVHGASVTSQPESALRPRNGFSSSSSRSTFSSFTSSLQTMSSHFEQCRTSLQSQTSIQGAVTILSNFRQNLLSQVDQFSHGCGCTADYQDGSVYSETIRTWFLELQTMIQLVQQKWPNDYSRYCSGIFSQISGGMQTALAVGYDAGIDIQQVVGGMGLNQQLFSSVSIQTSSFTSVNSYGSSFAGGSGVGIWKGGAMRQHGHRIRPFVTPLGGGGAGDFPYGRVSGGGAREPYGRVSGGGAKDFQFGRVSGGGNTIYNPNSNPQFRDPRGVSANSNQFGTSLAQTHARHH